MRAPSFLVALTLSISALPFSLPVNGQSLNQRIQSQLNRPTRYTKNFEIKPVRVLSEEAERRYQESIDVQRPEAILQATNFLKRNARYKRSANQSDRKTYTAWMEKLKHRRSTTFKPTLVALKEGAIGIAVGYDAGDVKILQALPDGLVRAEIGVESERSRREVFVRGIHGTSESDGAWAEFTEEVVFEVNGTRAYTTVVGAERTLPVLDVVNVAPFHAQLTEANKRPVRKARRTTPKRYPLREWTDTTGKYKLLAVFAGLGSGRVTLRKEDGSVVNIPLEKLSKDDREYIQSLRN